MALFTSRWRYGRRYRGRYARYTRRGRARSQQRAANQQRDSGTFVINVTAVADVRSGWATIMPIYEMLCRSTYFSNYANMYDQFKVDKIKVHVTQGTTSNVAGSFVSAWDRNGLDIDQVTVIANTGLYGKEEDDYALSEAIRSYSSSVNKSYNPAGSSFSHTRYLSPSTMQEKSQWIPTNSLREWTSVDATTGNTPWQTGYRYIQYPIATGSTDYSLLNVPNTVFTNNVYPFKPTLLMTIWSEDANAVMAANVEFDITVTFRGMRKGALV